MRAGILVLAILIGSSASAKSLCERNYADEDRESPGVVVQSRICELVFKDGSQTKVLQVVPLKKGCARFEGTPIVDCAWVRICSEKAGDRASGGPVYLDDQTSRELCRDAKASPLKLLPAESAAKGIQAYASCPGGRLQIELHGKGEAKTCVLPAEAATATE